MRDTVIEDYDLGKTPLIKLCLRCQTEFDHWSEVIPTTWIAAVYAFTSHRMGFFQIDTVAMSVLGSLNIYVANTI